MPIRHTVCQGESLISLGRRYGIPPDKILNHAENRPLTGSSRTKAILHPGDEVVIPDLETREEDCATDTRHRFCCQTAQTWLKLRFKHDDEPRANELYLLEVGGRSFSGELDDEGRLEVRIPADAQEALIFLGAERNEELRLRIGNIDPVEEISGVRQRLTNLGFARASTGDEAEEQTRSAIRAFQSKYDLPVTGEPDDATRARLVEVYGG